MQPETTYAFPGVNSYLIYTQDATDEELNVANQVRSQELQDLHDSLTVCPFSAKDLEVLEAKYRQEQKDKGQDKEEVAKENFPTSEQDDKMFTFASALTRSEKESQRLMGIELLLKFEQMHTKQRDALFLLGCAYYLQKDYQLARNYMRQLLIHEPKNRQAITLSMLIHKALQRKYLLLLRPDADSVACSQQISRLVTCDDQVYMLFPNTSQDFLTSSSSLEAIINVLEQKRVSYFCINQSGDLADIVQRVVSSEGIHCLVCSKPAISSRGLRKYFEQCTSVASCNLLILNPSRS